MDKSPEWELLYKTLDRSINIRFSLSSYRKGKLRNWQAVLYTEKGSHLGRGYGADPESAILRALEESKKAIDKRF